MEIVEKTSHRLRLEAENSATIALLVLVGTPFLLAGLSLTFFGERLTTLKCQRVEPTQASCQLVNSSLLRSKETKIPLNQLQSAKVDVNKDREGNNIYRVVLLTNSGEVPITSNGTSGSDEKQKNADRINAFIDNPEEISLHVQQDDSESVSFLGAIFSLAGGGLVFGSLLYGEFIVSYTFDKALDLVILKRQTLCRTKVTELRLREINQVDVKEKDGDGDKMYSVWLNLKSGKHISLSLQGITDKQNNQKIAECIRQFLNPKA